MVVLNKGVFGGGIYSTRGSRFLRMVGKQEAKPYLISIAKPQGFRKDTRGKHRLGITPPYMPKKITDIYHPGGNSLCYGIQTLHLMGCNPIIAVGFTLQSGSNYFFQGGNPVNKRKSTFYDTDRALDWLSWYQKTYPDRMLLDPSGNGPVYKVFRRATEDELFGKRQQRQEI